MKKKINVSSIGFKIILGLMFIGSLANYVVPIALIGSATIALLLSMEYLKKPNVEACKGLITLLLYQNLSIGLGAHIFANKSESLKLITQIPFLVITIIWIFLELKLINSDRNNKKTRIFFILLVVSIFFSLLIDRGSIQAILMNVRNLTVFFMAFEIGKYNVNDKADLDKIIKYIMRNALIFLVFGIVLNLLGYKGYEFIGIDEVYLAKGVQISGRLDDRFYTTLIKTQFLRMGSLLYEPVNLAYFYALSTIVAYFANWTQNKKLKIIFVIICGIGLILTFGKGGYLIVLATFLAYYLQLLLRSNMKKVDERKVYRISLIILAFFLVAFCIYYYKNIGAASSVHFWAVMGTWKNILKQPYGYGIGTGGNMSQLLNQVSDTSSWLDTGGETAFMSFMYQIGVQGTLFLVLCLLSMKKINLENNEERKLIYVFNYIPFILIGISMLQDNTFTPQCIVPFMIIQGALLNINIKKEEQNEKSINSSTYL